MHLVHIYKDYFPVLGGIENHLRDLSESLARRGHQVTALVTSRDATTTIEQPLPGLTVIKAGRTFHAASTPLSIAMIREARALRADLVHLHFPYPPGDLVAQAVGGKPQLVLTYHSDIVRQRNLLRVYRPLLEYTLHRSATILATSPNYVASSPWLERFAAKCAIVPLGVDTTRFAPATALANNPKPTILFVGRLRYYKGLHVLIDAMPEVDGELLIGGSGPERERLEQQARERGVHDRVRFLGDVLDAELPALYHRADVFVLPAHLRAEALGIAQIEAMASGLPCVSTELGTGTSFANQHGETGLVVPPNDPAALAQALNRLLADPALRTRMGQAARQRAVVVFGRDGMVDAVERVYADVLRS